ncbi:MAG TPA: methylated-DNA--[protein]-cysteine S-methyltransferase [Kofleriaceae bacterium]|nr:methylated-DNA--[protein]-cysteine S-methyltransferase [Kofleriaceae bacterium]
MTAQGFALFDTAIGRCGIAWSGKRIAGVQLPDGREAETRARVQRRFPGAREAPPPRDVRRAIDRIGALLRGEDSDLASIALDMEGVSPFHRRVYEAARAIPAGATASYGDIAALVGSPGAARAVGQALGRNPFALVVPCHRVLAAGQRVGGFSARGGIATKLRLLAIESGRAARAGAGAGAASVGGVGDGGGQGEGEGEGDGELGFDAAAALAHLRASDATLARLVDAVGPLGLRPDRTPSIFLALAEAIVYQQLTARAAATIFARVRALFARAHEGPTPAQVLRASDDKLRGAGLSQNKLLALRDLASRAASGELPTLAEVRRMDDEAIIERLSQVRGIGRWTVEMLLIFRLGRPDVLPVDDLGIRKGYALAFRRRELPGRADLLRRGERWRPYRTVASWYLWRAVERART